LNKTVTFYSWRPMGRWCRRLEKVLTAQKETEALTVHNDIKGLVVFLKTTSMKVIIFIYTR